ncbi:hypothetical protein [Amycolatopsis sp. NPDC004378]
MRKNHEKTAAAVALLASAAISLSLASEASAGSDLVKTTTVGPGLTGEFNVPNETGHWVNCTHSDGRPDYIDLIYCHLGAAVVSDTRAKTPYERYSSNIGNTQVKVHNYFQGRTVNCKLYRST